MSYICDERQMEVGGGIMCKYYSPFVWFNHDAAERCSNQRMKEQKKKKENGRRNKCNRRQEGARDMKEKRYGGAEKKNANLKN